MNLDSRWLLLAPALVTSYITLSFAYGYRSDLSFRANCSHFLFGQLISNTVDDHYHDDDIDNIREQQHYHQQQQQQQQQQQLHHHQHQQQQHKSSSPSSPSPNAPSVSHQHLDHSHSYLYDEQQGFNRVARSGQVYRYPPRHTMADDAATASSSPPSSVADGETTLVTATPTNSPSPSGDLATPSASGSPSYAAVVASNSTTSTTSTATSSSNSDVVGLRFGIGELQGRRPYMEDRSTAVMGLGTGDPHTATRCFFGVYDGHGGDAASSWCKQKMHLNLVKQHDFPDNMAAAMRTALLQTDREFLNKFPKSSLDDGSTVIFTVIELHASRLLVANAGDSRGVISRSGVAEALSEDHKPDRPDERARVEAHGGMVQQASLFGKFMGPYRVYTRVRTGGLAVSRGLGDGLLKQNDLVIAEPEIREIHLAPGDEFMVLATDGVWDVFSNQQVVDFVRRHYLSSAASTSTATSTTSSATDTSSSSPSYSPSPSSTSSSSSSSSPAVTTTSQKDPAQVADLLVREAIQRGSLDNVTAIVVFFDNHHQFTGTPPVPGIQSRTSIGSAQDQKTASLTKSI